MLAKPLTQSGCHLPQQMDLPLTAPEVQTTVPQQHEQESAKYQYKKITIFWRNIIICILLFLRNKDNKSKLCYILVPIFKIIKKTVYTSGIKENPIASK